jgi:uncharacterized membrane protein YphA (DoxX/SURF4 family)
LRAKSKKGYSGNTKGLLGISAVLLHAARILLAFVFLFSGFVKAVDPLGTVYKIEDYLTAFGGFWSGLTFTAFPAAFVLILLEFLTGIGLLLQLRMRLSSWVAFIFMLIMTPLTLYIAMYNPVTDCGCFGDALKLTNWQTFIKNLVFIVLAFIVLLKNSGFKRIFLPAIEWGMMVVVGLLVTGFMLYNLMYLPVMDFRPYKVGVSIPDAMTVPEDAPMDEYDYSFIYQKDGVQKTYSLDALPDSTWQFVSQESKLIRKGYEPTIKDLTMMAGNMDMTDQVLLYPGKSYLFILWNLDKSAESGIERIREFLSANQNPDNKAYVLTASSAEAIHTFEAKYQLKIPYYQSDAITLKTIIRANPGIVELENGIIKAKMNWRKFK